MNKKIILVGIISGFLALYARGNAEKTSTVIPPKAVEPKTNSVSTNAAPQELVQKNFPLMSTKGVLQLSFPKSWVVSSRLNSQGGIPMDLIGFHPQDSDEFAVLLEVVAIDQEKAKAMDLRKALTDASRAEATNSVSGHIDIMELKGTNVTGVYFTATDKRLALVLRPNPGDYKNLTQGYARLDNLVLTFRLVSNRSDEEKNAMLEMIKTARFSPGK
ncbi:MAG: hypothetical protein JWQ71_660 [Pedosphaera sp.]|nr:hypothetical protein [Pedosphaera sp.]